MSLIIPGVRVSIAGGFVKRGRRETIFIYLRQFDLLNPNLVLTLQVQWSYRDEDHQYGRFINRWSFEM